MRIVLTSKNKKNQTPPKMGQKKTCIICIKGVFFVDLFVLFFWAYYIAVLWTILSQKLRNTF